MAIGKKALAAALGWSRPTLDKRLQQDPTFPVVSRGTQAGGWAFDLETVRAYLTGATAEAEPPATDLPAPVPTAGGRVQHQGEATARQLKDTADAEWKIDRLRKSRGDLVEAAQMREVLQTVLVELRTTLTDLPDLLVRDFDLSERIGFAMRARIESAMRGAVSKLRTQLGVEPPPEDAAADA